MREFVYDGKLWIELVPGIFMEAKYKDAPEEEP